MCLAAVYKAQDPETKLFEFVSRIDVDGDNHPYGCNGRAESSGRYYRNGRPCKQHCEDQLHGILAVIK